MTNGLVVSVHPDDEMLGCGGSILKFSELGFNFSWIILTRISTKHGWDEKTVIEWEKIVKDVSKMYNFNQYYELDFDPGTLDKVGLKTIIGILTPLINEIKPEILFIPNRSDIHSDHKYAFQAIYSCTKTFRYPFINKVLMYECLSETEFSPPLFENAFVPNIFVDITKYFAQKLSIFNLYKSEIMDSPLPRSISTIEALSKFRGSYIGKEYAESFMLLKEIM